MVGYSRCPRRRTASAAAQEPESAIRPERQRTPPASSLRRRDAFQRVNSRNLIMRPLLAPNRMALPLRNRAPHRTGALDVRRDARRSPATTLRRGKVVLTAIVLAAAIALVAVASWPLKLLVVIAFVRGLFAADIVTFRNAARRRGSEEPRPTPSPGTPRRGAAGGTASSLGRHRHVGTLSTLGSGHLICGTALRALVPRRHHAV